MPSRSARRARRPNQLLDLEAARADMVGIQPTDVRRMEQRQFRIEASRPVELFVLAFEAHVRDGCQRIGAPDAVWRDRSRRHCTRRAAGRAEAADTLLPAVAERDAPIRAGQGRPSRLARSAVAALSG